MAPDMKHWVDNPNRYDVKGVDTPKKKPAKTKPKQQASTLPAEGKSRVVELEPNANGKTTLTIKNWKNKRYYLSYQYRTPYNQKNVNLGWIATDGSDWNVTPSPGANDAIQRIVNEIGGPVKKKW